MVILVHGLVFRGVAFLKLSHSGPIEAAWAQVISTVRQSPLAASVSRAGNEHV
jgi:hypothetical protein